LAGFEIRECLMWVFGSGFPKSHDVSKAIDRNAGAEREVVGHYVQPQDNPKNRWTEKNKNLHASHEVFNANRKTTSTITAPATEAAKQWQGWGSSLKPAYEPILLCRKPLEGTLAANVQEWGTGAINVDGCRVAANWNNDPSMRGVGYGFTAERTNFRGGSADYSPSDNSTWTPTQGRWPANLILSYNEDEYKLRETVTPQQLKRLSEWLCENT
jgi:hypothetical protein